MNRRKAIIATVALMPPLVVELYELNQDPTDRWPYTSYVLLLPRWVIALGLTTAYVVLWRHFINHD